jgi:hypothetical protein
MLFEAKPSRIGGPLQRHALLLALSLMPGVLTLGAQRVPLTIFTDLGLTSQQIAVIDAGRPVREGALVG